MDSFSTSWSLAGQQNGKNSAFRSRRADTKRKGKKEMKKKTETALLDVYINERFAGRIADSTTAIAHLVADALPSEKMKIPD